jgi:hypothetical protein
VQKLFDAAGIQSVSNPTAGTLTGYFSCSNPPTVGLGLPSAANASAAASSSSSTVSHKSTIFNILPSQLIQTQNGDNCTSSIVGTDQFPFWLVGQGTCFLLLLSASWIAGKLNYLQLAWKTDANLPTVFFQGKYVDHNHDDETMGFATLIN